MKARLAASAATHSLPWLASLGAVSTVLYLAVAQLSRHFAYGAPQTGRPIPLLLVLFAALFGIYLWATYVAVSARRPWAAVAVVVAFAVLFRVILLCSHPIQEVDVYRYLWDGAVTNQGVSPFRYAPETVRTAGAEQAAPAELQRLARLKNDPALATILDRVHFRQVHTIYPPVSQAVFAAADRLSPLGSSLKRRLLVMRVELVLFDLATVGIALALLRVANYSLGWVTAYAWCPLVLKEFANSGHLDSIVVLLTTAGLLLVVSTTTAADKDGSGSRRLAGLLGGGLLLGLGVGAKIYPLVLFPWLVAASLRQSRVALVGPLLFLLVSLVCLRPMLPPSLAGLPTGAPAAARQTAQHSGLATFTKYWEMNDFLFLIVVENLKPTRPDVPPVWFVVVPNQWRLEFVERSKHTLGWPAQLVPFYWARWMTTTVFAVIAVALAAVAYRQDTTVGWLRTAFLTLAWFWLLSPTQNPWYWTWALPLLPFARGRAWWAISGLVLLYYLRFWLEYEFPQPPVLGTPYHGTQFFDFAVTWLEFAPWLVWLALETWWDVGGDQSSPSRDAL